MGFPTISHIGEKTFCLRYNKYLWYNVLILTFSPFPFPFLLFLYISATICIRIYMYKSGLYMRKWDKWENRQNGTNKYAKVIQYVFSYKMYDGIMGKPNKLYKFLYESINLNRGRKRRINVYFSK